MTSARQLTCPKSPHCKRFLEEVQIEAVAHYVLDENFTPFEVTEPREVRVVHRSMDRVCAIHGVAPIVRLPAFVR